VATNYVGTKAAQHCINLVKNGGSWNAAVQNGNKVAAYQLQPISFTVN
jgi:hypothetical protein